MANKPSKKYHIVNGVSYKPETARDVVVILDAAREKGYRISVLYGDTKTGEPWKNSQWLTGYVGKGNTSDRLPVLLSSKRSSGGACIMDTSIVEIRLGKEDGNVLYTLRNKQVEVLGIEEKLVEPERGFLEVG